MFGVIGLLAGVIIAGFVAGQAVNNNSTGMMKMMAINTSKTTASNASTGHMGMSMDEMDAALKDKTGDDFDMAFISEMIDHHQGAIDMAVLAKQNAKHDEIKKLADDIIAAQTKEINEMKIWQQQWNYGTSQEDSDSMMNMMH